MRIVDRLLRRRVGQPTCECGCPQNRHLGGVSARWRCTNPDCLCGWYRPARVTGGGGSG